MTPWEIHGFELVNCNCDTGCPCQFVSLPTKGACEAAAAFIIEKGHYGDVDLSGLKLAQVFKWPGAVHEGNGTMQTVIDDRATPEQRAALEQIATGGDTEEMATFWWVFSAMSPHKRETLFRPIEITLDYEARTGTARVVGVFDTDWGPLINPVTGAEHRARISLPEGFEYRLAEVGKATTKTYGDLSLTGNVDSHAHMAVLHIGNAGLLEPA
ncbi:DUF1326 domain-containing protein [Pseudooceanicola sp. CBS1P-1]|uniref:DUF1326 domain-containing protein n=1 Tax=Pseudooceanicola albus TaxID=2692189 RepID=A0A6L7G5Q0_9RHOB|nr:MULTISPECIES: DUF1326 domain-containing protein [Pseudooceanicola]MBT9385905.1 DUF1326 domain-containing protein [Pseudooceanicola endophyticus]MXN19674.1 DUF1326 domain-containing protein [Pseudooceanicola albus]